MVLALAAAALVWWQRSDTVGTVYVSTDGDDTADGTSPATAWATLARVARADLSAGSTVRLARGGQFRGPWTFAASGTAAAEITIAGYGNGAPARITGEQSCLTVTGSFVTVSEIQVDDCGYAGVEIEGDDVTVRGIEATGSVAGVVVATGADRALVTRNRIADNQKMSVLTREPRNDDSGAFGVLLNGRNAEVSWNQISGHHATSYDYGEDGAGVEVFDATGSRVHHNLISDGSGVELGGAGSRDNVFSYNVISSTRPSSEGFVTRGRDDEFGPVTGTTVDNATIWMRGADTQGVVCYGGCTTDLLQLRNSIVVADRAVYVDGPFLDQTNLFSGTVEGTVTSPVLSTAALGLTDPDAGDFVPTATSPAVDAGSDLDPLSTPVDAADQPVNGAPDIGAYDHR